jgi:hypothetical protein
VLVQRFSSRTEFFLKAIVACARHPFSLLYSQYSTVEGDSSSRFLLYVIYRPFNLTFKHPISPCDADTPSTTPLFIPSTLNMHSFRLTMLGLGRIKGTELCTNLYRVGNHSVGILYVHKIEKNVLSTIINCSHTHQNHFSFKKQLLFLFFSKNKLFLIY